MTRDDKPTDAHFTTGTGDVDREPSVGVVDDSGPPQGKDDGNEHPAPGLASEPSTTAGARPATTAYSVFGELPLLRAWLSEPLLY